MERSNLICCLVGFFTANNPSISSSDLKIQIDDHLIKCHFTPLGQEENDLSLMDDLLNETIFSILAQGFNRKDRRSK